MIEDVVAELVPAINPEGKMRAGSCHRIPQSSSPSRFTAGTAGFLNFSQSGKRPDLWEPSLETFATVAEADEAGRRAMKIAARRR
jgi:hypothetical protein